MTKIDRSLSEKKHTKVEPITGGTARKAKSRPTKLREIVPIEIAFTNEKIGGRRGHLGHIPISDLRVDPSYQRSISMRSIRVVRKIASNFDWRKFVPAVVVKSGSVYKVINGQHSVTAAASLGIQEVPCYIIDCTHEEAASAFAAINGTVTPVSAQDVWFAMITAKDYESLELKKVLDACGVEIVADTTCLAPGKTRSISVLRRAWARYKTDTLSVVLRAIVNTGNGNAGMINGAVINGLARSLITKPWLLENPEKVYQALNPVRICEIFVDARVETARTGNPTQYVLTREFNAIFRHITA